MMNRSTTRRQFSKHASAAAIAAAGMSGIVEAANDDVPAINLQKGLRAWLNTLLPADEHSPAAGDVGVHLEIEARAKTIHNYDELLRRGMKWADDQAIAAGKLAFEKLDAIERARVVTAAEAEKAVQHSVPGQFFANTLRDGFRFYYGNAETWEGVGFPHAPQPIGFPDHADAPEQA